MKKKMIIEISASLVEKSEDKGMRYLEKIVKTVFDNRKKLKRAIINCEVNEYQFAVITLDLKKVSQKHIKKFGLNLLLDGTLPLKQCTSCGCYYSTFCFYTYRKNNDVIGRSYECVTCRGLSNQSIRKVQTVRQKTSARKAKNYSLNLLNGKTLFKKRIVAG